VSDVGRLKVAARIVVMKRHSQSECAQVRSARVFQRHARDYLIIVVRKRCSPRRVGQQQLYRGD
jgi:hypothetical protein